MIIRKPYAFLIKHFKRIHVFMLLLCCFVYYKSMQTRSFITEFLELETYDAYYEPITKYASVLAILAIIILIFLSGTLIVLLRHKKKPWKLYVVPFFSYIFLFITFVLAITLFSGYDRDSGTTGIRAINDLLFMGTIPQYVIIIIILVRIFGLDLNKFDFKSDQEFLELSKDDREEIEISVNVDKESFKRLFKRLLRNINYFYQEHKFICNIIISIIVVVLVVSIYRFIFITHRSYNENDVIPTDGYLIEIHHSYFTDKDFTGNVISKDSNFVVLDITLTNTLEQRAVNLNRFHIMNKTENYSQTYRTFETDFKDLGTTYEELTLDRDEKQRFLLIFKVDKELDPNKFVLYYQEFNDGVPYLRKIKLDIEDVSQVERQKVKTLTENETLHFGDDKVNFTIDSAKVVDYTTYTTRECSTRYSCYANINDLYAKEGKKILELFFTSDTFTGQEFVDFSEEYGKIVYIDNKGKKHNVTIKNSLRGKYSGNYMYFDVPEKMSDASKIRLIYTVRDWEYVYRLK